ncbi:hypothetical protein LEMLEM_LOCUS18419 [Lemmus lemmus]
MAEKYRWSKMLSPLAYVKEWFSLVIFKAVREFSTLISTVAAPMCDPANSENLVAQVAENARVISLAIFGEIGCAFSHTSGHFPKAKPRVK